ncbi:MAG TPA: class D beta-lactamase [Rhizobiaceae bacterium]|nr:class D beta-lactamase [Rhizobiaceae bacterium]
MARIHALVLALPFLALSAPAQAKMLCTVVADLASGEIVAEDGDCSTRVTPASTFKIALAIVGFDSSFLKDAHAPTLSIEKGEPDWGGEDWRKPTDPARWLKYSVVWYSQRIAKHLGSEKFSEYVKALDYGNADVSGDPGKDNGLERSWISSSLKISPVEQVGFLSRFLTGRLPVGTHAVEQTIGIVEAAHLADWTVSGKTGSAFPRRKDGSFDRARGWGWFVGWATNGSRTYVFARLDQDEKRESGPGGLRARQKFLDAWPDMAKGLAK